MSLRAWKETGAQCSGPFSNFIVQHLQQWAVKIWFPEQDRHNVLDPNNTLPGGGLFSVPDSSISEKQIQTWSVGCVFLVTVFLFLCHQTAKHKEQESVTSYSNEYKNWSTFYHFRYWKCGVFRDLKREATSDTQTGFSRRSIALFCLSTSYSWELNPIETQCSFSLTWTNSRLKTRYIVIYNKGEPALLCGLAHSRFPAVLLPSLMLSFRAHTSLFLPIEESPKSR